MRRIFIVAGGLFFLWLWGMGVETRSARATSYDYGVGLSQTSSVSDAVTGKSFTYTTPHSASPTTGITSLSHSQSDTLTGPANFNYYPPVKGTGTFNDYAQVDMGAIHLVSSAGGTGQGGANTGSYGIWSDILTIGNNFASGTPLKFLVNLDLTGSVDATSSKLPGGGGSIGFAEAQSFLSVQDNITFKDTVNQQQTCMDSYFGKQKDCKTSLSDFSYVLKTYPGAKVTVLDSLLTQAYASGDFRQYPYCGTVGCTVYASSAADSSFLDTALFTFTPLTSGAFYTTASGASYLGAQSAVPDTPEPPTGFLILTGILGIAAWKRKKALLQILLRTDGRQRA
jgi:hypothetical protein